ncbi:serine/threonine-protein kinase [Nocardioides caricicola]|uniref:non-specific serine/threonine protein kinase n=1 Tax=Nocardioides caricicola TaxID=634770 RepID=A0ABW0N0P2_9ACTN
MDSPLQQTKQPDGAAGVLGDRYRLGDLLGRGGMADVFRGTDQVLDRPVAVKVLRDGADVGADRARFTGEARTLARLSHRGLVTVLDAGITDDCTADRPFLVMELVEGPTLAALVADGPLDLERVAAIGSQVAEALAYAHERGVVHRDVKPGNVLLGDGDRVKLADFGIARLIGDTVRHTRTGQAIGTAAYLAPEQVTGREVDGATDVYALGLVLLEAITGVRAYPGTPTEAAIARLTRQPDVPDDLPANWRDLLVAMTALEPADRPSASAVAALLRDAPAADRTRVAPAVAPPPEPAWRAWVRQRPAHQWGATGAVFALLVLLLVTALVSGGAEAGNDIPPDTPTELQQPLRDLHEAVEG